MNYTLSNLTAHEVDLIGAALSQRPYIEVHQLISRLQVQVSEQESVTNPPQQQEKESS